MNIFNKSIGVLLIVFIAFGILILIHSADAASKPVFKPSPNKTVNIKVKINFTPTNKFTVVATTQVPLSAEGYYNEGMKLFNQSLPIQAITQFERATSLNPDYAAAWLAKARAQSKIAQYQTSVDSYSQVNRIDPGNYDAWYEKAKLLERLNRYKDAYDAYNRALGLKPDNPDLKSTRDKAYVASVRGFSFGAEMGYIPYVEIPY